MATVADTLLRYHLLVPIRKQHREDLYRLFAAIDTPEEAKRLLDDLLTPQELESLAERWQLVQHLARGVPQREIAKEFDLSISKITRGSRAYKYGKGGFEYFLKKLQRSD